jgi:hypothetical protein
LSLVAGCGETTSDVDTTGSADSPPRGGVARDAGDAAPRNDGARDDDARANGGGSGGPGGSALDDDTDDDSGPAADDDRSDDDSHSDDDAEPTPVDDGPRVAPSTPPVGPPPPTAPGVVGEVTWDPEDCHVPTLEATSDPIVQMQRALAREYCETIDEHGCLERELVETHTLDNCSDEERIGACLHIALEIHNGRIFPECEDAWSEAIACATQSFGEGCPIYGFGFPYGPQGTCPDENDALLACVGEHPTWNYVEGSYTSCDYGPGITNECEVVCQISEEDYAGLNCGGPDGVPMRCSCDINGIPLNDIPVGTPDEMWVDDCEDAARQAADGMCTSRLECCFEYSDGGKDQCLCGAIPERAGFDSCEALADSVMGHVVDICPRYENPGGSCWPPPCN